MADAPAVNTSNPYKDLPFAELVKMLNDQADTVIKAVEAIAKIERNAEGKEVLPYKDPAGKTRYAASAFNSQFKSSMKEYGGLAEMGKTINTDAANLRTKLIGVADHARKMKSDIAEGMAQLETQAEVYRRASGPRIKEQLAREEAKKRKLDEKIARLTAAASGNPPPKTSKSANG